MNPDELPLPLLITFIATQLDPCFTYSIESSWLVRLTGKLHPMNFGALDFSLLVLTNSDCCKGLKLKVILCVLWAPSHGSMRTKRGSNQGVLKYYGHDMSRAIKRRAVQTPGGPCMISQSSV